MQVKVVPNYEKKKSPWLWLLMIPLQIAMDIVLFNVAIAIDSYIIPNPNALGHPVPALTLMAFVTLPVITLVVIIIALILSLIAWFRTK